jgi:hypothetical protein
MTSNEINEEMAGGRRGAAYHEAGHAVIAWILGMRISSIRLYAQSNRQLGGGMWLKKDRYSLWARAMFNEVGKEGCPDIARAVHIVVLFAGALAQIQVVEEALHDYVLDVNASSDKQEVFRLLAAMGCTKDQAVQRGQLLNDLCEVYLFEHWKHVEDLARALLANGRILKAKEIRQILGPRTMPLRTAIEHVRQALEASHLPDNGA